MDWLDFLGEVATECVLEDLQRSAFIARFEPGNSGKTNDQIAAKTKDELGNLVFAGRAAFTKLMTAVYGKVAVRWPELAELKKGKKTRLAALLQAEFKGQEAGERPVQPLSGVKPGAPWPDKKIVLMLPAKLESTTSTRWKKEVTAARKVIEKSDNKYEFQERGSIIASDLLQTLSDVKPYVLHICGRAEGIAELVVGHSTRDVYETTQDHQLISKLFNLNAKSIICVVLSGCLIEDQIREINHHIEVVIAISELLEEEMSIKFVNAFYYFLSDKDIDLAYESAIYQLRQDALERKIAIDNSLLPRIFFKKDEINRREWEKALSDCVREMAGQPKNIELLKRKASLLKDLNRIDELTEVYNKISELEPNKYENRVKQGDDLEELGDSEKACDAYAKALEMYDTYFAAYKEDKEQYKVWWKKAKSHTRSEQYTKAAESYKQSLLLCPSSPDNYVICREYGSVLEVLRNNYESIELYRTSVCLQSKYRAASYHRKKLYQRIYSEKGEETAFKL